jgi:hypothetical protein
MAEAGVERRGSRWGAARRADVEDGLEKRRHDHDDDEGNARAGCSGEYVLPLWPGMAGSTLTSTRDGGQRPSARREHCRRQRRHGEPHRRSGDSTKTGCGDGVGASDEADALGGAATASRPRTARAGRAYHRWLSSEACSSPTAHWADGF